MATLEELLHQDGDDAPPPEQPMGHVYPGDPKTWVEQYPVAAAMAVGMAFSARSNAKHITFDDCVEVENGTQAEMRVEIYIGIGTGGWRHPDPSTGKTRFKREDTHVIVVIPPNGGRVKIPRRWLAAFFVIRNGMIVGGGCPLARVVGVEPVPVHPALLPDTPPAQTGQTR